MFTEQEDANEASFCVYAATSPLPSEHPSTATSSGPYSHRITRIGSDLEALITEHVDEDNDINSIFDVLKVPTSHAILIIAAFLAPHNMVASHSVMTSFAVASIRAMNAPQNMVSALIGMTCFSGASIGAMNAPQNTLAVTSIGAMNAPQNMVAADSRMTSFSGSSIGATSAPQNTVAAPAQLPPSVPSSNFGIRV
ncbi:hypothetical protein T459_22677 [Capsicum annuum]|uniref:Uncharacterized protein n=1 Tax=Capsicum annuum TaxID=4072 RepID=A0A2G2YQ63_CAPAN|nr:hypothetical protein T459_22677 [Capsicum annuum]